MSWRPARRTALVAGGFRTVSYRDRGHLTGAKRLPPGAVGAACSSTSSSVCGPARLALLPRSAAPHGACGDDRARTRNGYFRAVAPWSGRSPTTSRLVSSRPPSPPSSASLRRRYSFSAAPVAHRRAVRRRGHDRPRALCAALTRAAEIPPSALTSMVPPRPSASRAPHRARRTSSTSVSHRCSLEHVPSARSRLRVPACRRGVCSRASSYSSFARTRREQ